MFAAATLETINAGCVVGALIFHTLDLVEDYNFVLTGMVNSCDVLKVVASSHIVLERVVPQPCVSLIIHGKVMLDEVERSLILI